MAKHYRPGINITIGFWTALFSVPFITNNTVSAFLPDFFAVMI
jgi:hypothetical protein